MSKPDGGVYGENELPEDFTDEERVDMANGISVEQIEAWRARNNKTDSANEQHLEDQRL